MFSRLKGRKLANGLVLVYAPSGLPIVELSATSMKILNCWIINNCICQYPKRDISLEIYPKRYRKMQFYELRFNVKR